jgi:hypothetical protein
VQVADSPLSPRVNAAAVWTGDEVLVIGGDEDAPCVDLCLVEPLPTAAAYDPATDEWRELSDVPGRWFSYQGAVVAAGTVFTPGELDGQGALLTYDVADDDWDHVEPPGTPALPRQFDLVGAHDRLIFVSTCFCPHDPSPNVSLDVRTGAWEELPDDPFPNAARREVVGVGDDLYVFTSQGGTGQVQGAVLHDDADRWTGLPALADTTLPHYPEQDPVVVDDFVVLDGPLAAFDTGTGHRTSLPSDLQGSVPHLDSRPEVPYTSATTWIGDRWFAFGGRLLNGLTDDAYTWSPG